MEETLDQAVGAAVAEPPDFSKLPDDLSQWTPDQLRAGIAAKQQQHDFRSLPDDLSQWTPDQLRAGIAAHRDWQQQQLAITRMQVDQESAKFDEPANRSLRGFTATIRRPMTDIAYGVARGNLASGRYSPDDLRTIALYEAEKQRDAAQPFAVKAAQTTLGIPGEVAAFTINKALGLGKIAFDSIAGRSAQLGQHPLSPEVLRGAAGDTAVMLGTFKGAGVLAEKIFPGAKTALQAGLKEAATMPVAGEASEAVGKLLGLKTKYGPLTELFAGDGHLDEAALHTLGASLLGFGFGVSHGNPTMARRIEERVRASVDQVYKAGGGKAQAAKAGLETLQKELSFVDAAKEFQPPAAESTQPTDRAPVTETQAGNDFLDSILRNAEKLDQFGKPLQNAPESLQSPKASQAAEPPPTQPSEASVAAIGGQAAPTERQLASQPSMPDDLGFRQAFEGAGRGASDKLYQGVFEALRAGESKFRGVPDPLLVKAKPLFDQGLIKSPADLRALFEAGYDPVKAGLVAPKPTVPESAIEQLGKDIFALKRGKRESIGEFRSRIEALPGGKEILAATDSEFSRPAAGTKVIRPDDPNARSYLEPVTSTPSEVKPAERRAVERGPDRRTNEKLREMYDRMSPEERQKALFESPVTGLPNRRAFDAGESKAVAMSDADGLKAFNDAFGYAAGDDLLRAKAEALRIVGVDAYHEKGDEFLYRGDSPELLRKALERARRLLREAPLEVKMKDGTTKVLRGADFSYGLGTQLADAETGLKAHKAEREARGERARGELRGFREVGGAELGRVDPAAGAAGGSQETADPRRPLVDPLSPVERQVIEAREAGETLPAIGRRLGFTKQRAEQIEKKALAKLGRDKSVAAEQFPVEQAERADILKARGRGVSPGELGFTEEEAGSRRPIPMTDEEKQLEAAGTEFLRQAEEAARGEGRSKAHVQASVKEVRQSSRGRGVRAADESIDRAKAEGIDLNDLREHAEAIRQQHIELSGGDTSHNAIITEAYDALKAHGVRAINITQPKRQGRDQASIKGFDVVVQELMHSHKGILGDDPYHASEKLWQILQEGKRPEMTVREAYEKALDELIEHRDQAGATDAESQRRKDMDAPTRLMGMDVKPADQQTVDGIRFELFDAPGEGRGVMRVVDIDADQVVTLKSYADRTSALRDFRDTVSKARAQAKSAIEQLADRWIEEGTQKFRDLAGGEIPFSGFDPELATAFAKFTAGHILKGSVTFAEFVKGAVLRFGEAVRPHLRAMWKQANQFAEEARRATKAPEAVGIKNVSAAEQRERAGLDPVEPPRAAGHEHETLVARAAAIVASDPTAVDRLIASIKANPDRLIDEQGQVLLTYKARQVENAYKDSLTRLVEAQKAGNLAELVEAQRTEAELKTQLDELTTIGRPVGTDVARALAARRAMLKEDFSLAYMVMQAEAAKGRPLTPQEKAEIVRLHERIAALTAQLAGKKGPSDIGFELDQAKRGFRKGLADDRLAAAPWPKKIIRTAGDILSLPRSIMASIDFPLLRQGMMATLAHPVRTLKGVPEMLKSFVSAEAAERARYEIEQRPNAELYKRAGLEITDMQGDLTKREEFFVSRLADRIPGLRTMTRASERAYQTTLNRIRADSFDALVGSLSGKEKMTANEAKLLANFVNVTTGRGNLGRFQNDAALLSQAFFAPRWTLSRFQTILGQPLWTKLGEGSPRARAAVAKEYARAMVGLGVVAGLGVLAGGQLENDPRSGKFGKLFIGNTTLDLAGGLAGTATFLSRMMTLSTKTQKGDIVSLRDDGRLGKGKFSETLGRFVRGKLAPLPGAAISAMDGSEVSGEPVTTAEAFGHTVTPLFVRDVYDALKDLGIPKGTAVSLLGLLGMSMQTYDRDGRKKFAGAGAR